MTTIRVRWPALAAALCMALPTVLAGVNDDAGTGSDAGDTRATALAIAFGSSFGAMNPSDVDVFSAPGYGAPECVVLTATANAPAYASLTLTRAGEDRTSLLSLAPGVTTSGGVARGYRDGTFARFAPAANASGVTSYQFQLSTLIGFAAPENGDASSLRDAGQMSSEAIRPPSACFGGRLTLSDFLDTKDAFLVTARAGEVIRYSLVTSAPAIPSQLTLVDPQGTQIGGVVTSGGVAETVAPRDGTYVLMMSSSSTSARDLDYLIGWGTGPDPNGCRPYCM